ncbi:hypothetical protein FRC03_012646 [Tulasnella sp. 419]|nr:hypothetical protein FRC03_012646 [Tulasnella sp. 419]
MGNVHIESGHLVGTSLGQAAYGLYTYLTGRVFVNIKQGRSPTRIITAFFILLWLLTSVTQGIRVWTTYTAFITRGNVIGANQFYDNEYRKFYQPAYKFVAYLNGVFADSLMCWRVYVVWNRKKKVLILPVALLVGLIGSMCVAFSYQIKDSLTDDDHGTQQRPWILAAVFMTLSVNLLVTIMICWRLWCVVNDVARHSASSSRLYRHLIYIMAESGALYTGTLCLYFILSVAKMEVGSIIVTYLLPPVTGMMPTLVILRLFSSPDSENSIANSDSPIPSLIPTTTEAVDERPYVYNDGVIRLGSIRRRRIPDPN